MVVSSRIVFLPDWTKTQSGYSDSNRTESSLHVQLPSKRRERAVLNRNFHRRIVPVMLLAGARRAAGGDRERRARHRDGGPLQRGGPRRGRDRGKRLLQRLHRIDGGGAGALTDSRAALRRKAARKNRRGDASDRLARARPRRARGPAA